MVRCPDYDHMVSHPSAPSFVVAADSGLIAPARQCPSPNCDARPDDVTLDLIVIHGISLPPGEFGNGCIASFFCNQLDPSAHPYFGEIAELRVSAHLLVERDGSVIQFVSFLDRAWHAGVSSWQGRERCNDFSIGIELEGTDELAYSAAQYATLNTVLAALRTAYPTLTDAAVVGHSDIAPGRKTDPGTAFDWDALQPVEGR
ncbi:MAG: 1,6-anhydro-N-acetylmuramyl-L-alanine amidase AmpD [Pseudomonadota bacterium]